MVTRALGDERGFTLVEVLIAALVLLVAVVATMGLFDAANKATAATRQREAANSLERELVEGARSVPFDTLVGTTALNARLQAMPGLEDDTAGGGAYTINRRGTSFTVTTSVCTMDDPQDDGGANRASGVTFCSGSAPAGGTDKNPEDYRRVAVTLTWQAKKLTRSVTQTAVVNNPGSAAGPAVASLQPAGYAAPYEISNAAVTSVQINLTTSSRPAVVNWNLDGSPQLGAVTPQVGDTTGQAWQFTWPIGAVDGGLDDGPYLLSAEAFNTYGVSGPSRTETVLLNRSAARKVQNVAGGRDRFGRVQLEWSANTERDIIGYEVERTNASGTTLATPCPFTSQKLDTSCIDASPPADAAAYPIFYRVRAYDRQPGSSTPRAGAWSDLLKVTFDNRPPNPPTQLSATTTAGGTSSAVVTLTFKRPSPEDPDAGDSVAFYRIYRDGTALADRYQRWYATGNSVTWTDTKTGASTHTYYVTAVDTHFAESNAQGPVTGG